MTDKTPKTPAEADTHEANPRVYTDNVALPEVRTGKVDLEGDFERDQEEIAEEHHVSFDTVALPEYHTGKAAEHDQDAERAEHAEHHKHGGLFSDLARILANGGPDE